MPKEMRDKINCIKYYAGNYSANNVIRIDDWIEDKKVSLVTMDIECMEIEALKGMENTIICQRPILAISAYHRWDDLIIFTTFLQNIEKEYHFYLRKYASRLYMTKKEIVLYAVPPERILGRQ